MRREEVIVIDDIERMHEKLGIGRSLGFIEHCTQRHKVRFVLVPNSDQLVQRKLWNTLCEEVLGQALKLLITSEASFAVVVRLSKSQYPEAIKRSSVICRLVNIRNIGKVIKAANRISSERELEDAMLARVVPSIVLLAAIHCKGIEDIPDFDKEKEPMQKKKRLAKGRLLINELSFLRCIGCEVLSSISWSQVCLTPTSSRRPLIVASQKSRMLRRARKSAPSPAQGVLGSPTQPRQLARIGLRAKNYRWLSGPYVIGRSIKEVQADLIVQ